MATHQQKSESAPRGLVQADQLSADRDLLQPLCDQGTIVQCAEDNPRALNPGAPLPQPADGSVKETTFMLGVLLDDISQPLSRSSRVRKNTRAKQWSRRIPRVIRTLMSLLLTVIYFLWYIFAISAAFTIPGLLTLATGNAMCKAANLPHFADIETAIAVGAIGGFFATLPCLVFVIALRVLGDWMEKWFKERNIRSGRVSHDTDRENGHFPVLLLWIPLVFLPCLFSGLIGIRTIGIDELSKADVAKMSAIGGVIVAPGWIIVSLLTYGVLETVYIFLCELSASQELEGKGEPEMLSYLWRQGEALVWLLLPVSQVQSSPAPVAISV